MANKTAMILPYQLKLGQAQYLIHRELIPFWDSSSDLCGISISADEDFLDQTIEKIFMEKYVIRMRSNELKALGVCAMGRDTDEFVYLYAIDLTGRKDLEHLSTAPTPPGEEITSDKVFWCTEDILLESVDAQLIACYAKIKHLLL